MDKRKLTAEDIFSIELVGDNARHPSQPKAAVVVQQVDEKENTYRSHIWMVSTEDGSKSLFTNSSKSETAPAWSPDGRWLAFLSNRNRDAMQLYVMPEAGGEAVVVTDIKEGVEFFQWSPNGTEIAFVAQVEMTNRSKAPEDSANEAPREKFTKDVRKIQRSFYRLDGVGFFGDKRGHLHIVDLRKLAAGSKMIPDKGQDLKILFPCVQVTHGEFDIDSFDFSPDGRTLVVATNIHPDAEKTFEQHLYEISLPHADTRDGMEPVPVSAMRCLTPTFHAAAKPKYSPNGQQIGFKGENHQRGATTLTGLYLYDVASGQVTWLTKDTDEIFENRSIADTRTNTSDALEWSSDGRFLYTLLSRRGTVQVVRVAVDTGSVEYLTRGNHCVLSYSWDAKNEELVLTIGTATDPANVYVQYSKQTQADEAEQDLPRLLTDWNQRFLESVELSTPERFEFESDGLMLDGWVMFPSEPASEKGYPTVLQVHGGPAMMYADAFFSEFQLLAANGMAVIYTNPRGSVGYGQDFASCIEMDWGNLDFKDVEKLADAALARYPLCAEQVGIAGGSYGGFMSAWAIGHTKRYKAAVVMRAVINWYSMMASDVGFATPAEEFGGKAPWDDPELYMRISPITYVNQVETSTLIIHSENDYRCPIDQGEQFYIALKLRGVPVEFVRFPEESHGLSRGGKPWHRVVRLEEIAGFLSRELGL
ncbi:S9 family peptidase [Alicyclobacillus ferrooxydans]|uniref:Peptidase S9 prolyl oligopeptidase catalytic domain-containing protein n=1 Tax=Alicyclobacillus ferrooxydans TaxID=471514 RepID=A0A0P9D583_9BACL|nr:S9 family peptidase [Alicyclobacillus ferrooxydans]KPV44601.1 hypothetical protein AN477_06290 [Alicyclobacillus ferrooxydans]